MFLYLLHHLQQDHSSKWFLQECYIDCAIKYKLYSFLMCNAFYNVKKYVLHKVNKLFVVAVKHNNNILCFAGRAFFYNFCK